MINLGTFGIALALILATEAAVAQQIYSREPGKGQIRSG